MFFSSLILFTVFFSRDTLAWIEWFTFIGCLLVGCLVGLILAKLSKLGVAVLAGWGGFCLSLILYNAFIYKLDNHKSLVFWSFCIIFAVGFGLLTLFIFDHIIIISSSIIGAYAVMRGISMYAGGFPDEIDLVQYIRYGLLDKLDPSFYGYMAGFIVGALICMFVQYKVLQKKRDGPKYRHPYHRYKWNHLVFIDVILIENSILILISNYL